ncbi:hypothetical protein GC177_05840 [bacterium]|nr:hypothetical protein [bacterium]
MDAALQAMLAGQGAGGGNHRMFGMFPDIESTGLESVFNLGQLSFEEFLKKLMPMLQQALVFNFPGGMLWQKIFQEIVKMLSQQVDTTAYGISVGEVGNKVVASAARAAGAGGSGHEL